MRLTSDETAALVRAASSGDRGAWEALVDAYMGLVWAIARGHQLDDAGARGVTHVTWLRLTDEMDRLPDPGRVAVWLAATAGRESLRAVRQSGRQVPATGRDAFVAEGPRDEDLCRDVVLECVAQRAPAKVDRAAQVVPDLHTPDAPASGEEVWAGTGVPGGRVGRACSRTLRHLSSVMARVCHREKGRGNVPA